MLCDEVSVLEETLKALDELDLHVRRLGARGFLIPVTEIDSILDTLAASGTFPRILRVPEAREDDTDDGDDTETNEEASS